MNNPMFVKKADHENEALAAFKLKRMLNWFGVKDVEFRQAIEDEYSHFDFRMYMGEEWTGVVEVRTRNITSDQVEKWGSLIINTNKLAGLKELFYHEPMVKGERGWWSKEIIFVWQCSKDGFCYAINMEALLEVWGECEDAPQEMMKLDHGEGMHEGDTGKLIPVKYMRVFV